MEFSHYAPARLSTNNFRLIVYYWYTFVKGRKPMSSKRKAEMGHFVSRRTALAVFSVCFLSQPAWSQDEAEEFLDDEFFLEEVVVTGTRIKRRDFSSPSPLTTITKQDFEFSGQPTLEEYLNQMPQVQPDFGRASNNPGDGTAKLNLRALGSGRTLILMNGRRVAPSGIGSSADVNNIPGTLVERVEIITGGASTVYGSDAIAGVVNFITRDDFDGLSFDGSYNISGEGDAEIWDFNVVYGHNFDGGNITFFAGQYEREPLFAGERELTSFAWFDDWESGVLQKGGSYRAPGGVVFGPQADFGNGPVFATWSKDGTPRAIVEPDDLYNYAPITYLQVPLSRQSVGMNAVFEVGKKYEAYVEASYTKNEASRQLAPAPFGTFVVVNSDNPILTPQTRQLFEEQWAIGPGLAGMFLARRMLELGPRIADTNRKYTRFVGGIRGELSPDWEIDAWVTYTDATESELLHNDGSISRLQQGLLVDPVTGQCFDPSGGCVPLDVFGEGRLSTEGVEFLSISGIENTTNRTQTLAAVVVTGSPFDIWSGPVDMAFGAEWRKDEGDYKADDVLFTGDTMGYRGAAPVLGTEKVFELYSEAIMTLFESTQTSQKLDLEIGARYSEYDNAGGATTWKAGLDWRLTDSIRFRAMLQHAVRAPNNAELFQEQFTESYWQVDQNSPDPCSASADPVGMGNADKCISQGLPANQIGVFEAIEFYPVGFTNGGNPNLLPEISDTMTFGFVINPVSIPELTIAIDYFDLEVADTIGGIDRFGVCFDPANTAGLFCQDISRDGSGNIVEIFGAITNRGLQSTEGVDLQLQYRVDLPESLALNDEFARFSVNSAWTHTISRLDQPNLVSETKECAGYFGWPCGRTNPENRMTTNFNYSSGPLNARLTWRWVSSMKNGAPLRSYIFGVPDPVLALPKTSSYSYFDLGFGYEFSESLNVRFGINNLFDKQAPNMADAVWTNNTDTGMYDVFGRSYYLSFSYSIQ
jgi:iron complex outermembrane receptor protein